MKRFISFLLALLLSACIAQPTPEATSTPAIPQVITAEDNPYSPLPGDASLRLAGVVLDSINLVERSDLAPTRVELNLFGSLPSVCNQLRVEVSPPNEQYQIFVEVYSLINPNLSCDNVFQQFEDSVLLGQYSPGKYTVWINKGYIGDFVTE